MSVLTEISIVHTGPVTADIKNKLTLYPPTNPHVFLAHLTRYISLIDGGNALASIDCRVDHGDGVQASGTFTFTAQATANDTVLINGVTFTAVASGATGNQWNVGASATATAANLVIAVNASVTALVKAHVVATSALGVVTIKSIYYGALGNAATIAKGVDSGSVNTASGARLTGGVDPSANTYKIGV